MLTSLPWWRVVFARTPDLMTFLQHPSARRHHSCPHWTDYETEAQRGQVTQGHSVATGGTTFKPMSVGTLAQRGDILAPILSHLPQAPAGLTVLALISSSQDWWGSSCGPSLSSTCKPSVSPLILNGEQRSLTHSCITSAEDWPRLSPQGPQASPFHEGIWLSCQQAQGSFACLRGSHLSAVCSSVREEPLSSSWETRVRRDQGHTEACTSGCFTPGPSVGWRLPHRAKSSRRPLSPWGCWGPWTSSPELSQRTSVQAVPGLLTRWEVRGWSELSYTWPLPFVSCVISGNLLEPQLSHCPVELTGKPPCCKVVTMKRVNEWKMLNQSLTLVSTRWMSTSTHLNYCQCWEIPYSIFINCISLNYDLHWMIQWMDIGVGVATESQRGEVTSPGPHSWSEGNRDLVWSQSPPVLVLSLLAVARDASFPLRLYFVTIPSPTQVHREGSRFRTSLEQ